MPAYATPIAAFALTLLATGAAQSAVIDATPADYRTKIAALRPGDTLRLSAGDYTRLTLSDLNGLPDQWITIEGPTSGAPAVIRGESCCNTVQIQRCSYLAVRRLVIDSLGMDAIDGINVKDGVSHDIVIEGNRIQGVGASQQTVGISTKSTVWRFTVRGNTIVEPGTGMYFGNSDGSSPFIAGVIENNLVLNPTGYAVQIKHQNAYSISGAPDGPSRTIFRHNVLVKDGRPSPDGDRPNLLVGPFPASGTGASDLYEIYGNFLYGNPRESLMQLSGRVVVHDNVLVPSGTGTTAMLLTDHEGTLQLAYVYNNTIYGAARGIRFGNAPRADHLVLGNAVFADDPISGALSQSRDNVTGSIAAAATHFVQPSYTLGGMDFYPRAGQLQGSPLAYPASFASHADAMMDFNGRSKGSLAFRGAYAGESTNPGWRLDAALKPVAGGAAAPMPPYNVSVQ